MSRCKECDSDLHSRMEHKGEVRCTNKKCRYHKKAHPTGSELNVGKA